MPFSSSTNFFYFPISNSKIHNSVSLYTTSTTYPRPPPAGRGGYLSVKCNGGTGSSVPQRRKDDDDDNNEQTLERAHKLYEVIKNKNMKQLSEVLADECPEAYKSIPFLRFFGAKLQVLEFFSHLFKSLGNSLQFTVKPTTKDGSMVGIKWKLGWEKTLLTLGKGININSHHTYAGMLLIGNLETILDHFVQLQPMRLVMDLNLVPKQRRKASLFLGFFLLALSLFFFNFSVR